MSRPLFVVSSVQVFEVQVLEAGLIYFSMRPVSKTPSWVYMTMKMFIVYV